MNKIIRLLKRINCNHNWIDRNVGNSDSAAGLVSSKRCSKCKWVKHDIIVSKLETYIG